VRIDGCGGTVSANSSLIQNPNYPTPYRFPGTCTYTVNRESDHICQIRLDWNVGTFNYASSGTTGCVSGTTDYIQFKLKNGVDDYSPVCGTLTGEHMYYEVGTTGDTLELSISLVGTTNRYWSIQVTQISCKSPWRAPVDCLQWYTGITGTIKSFNFASGQVLSSQNYRICIRQELGYCSIGYIASSDTVPDPFQLPTGSTGTTTTATNCNIAYIGIPIGGDTGIKDSKANRYCGTAFAPSEGSTFNGIVSSAVVPFEVFFFSNNAKLDKSTYTGFNFNYRQNLC